MTSSTDQSAIAVLIATGRVKFISMLVVIALVLGLFTEVLSLFINYYTLKKLQCDMVPSMTNAAACQEGLDIPGLHCP